MAARGVFPNESKILASIVVIVSIVYCFSKHFAFLSDVTADEIESAFVQICPYYPCSVIQFQANDPFTHIINGYAFQVIVI